jgi:hypothetical protein
MTTYSVIAFSDLCHTFESCDEPKEQSDGFYRKAKNGHWYNVGAGFACLLGDWRKITADLKAAIEAHPLFREILVGESAHSVGGRHVELWLGSDREDHTGYTWQIFAALDRCTAKNLDVTGATWESDPTTTGSHGPCIRLANGKYVTWSGIYEAANYAFSHSPHPRWLTDGATFSKGVHLQRCAD